ncbi:hypothetical protein BCR44DRAFT_1541131 [Catenaria anguillulae PL171]|uniref:Uncharacterized protein n=1 Tax=Catenaria anguillulae PL171 TaxID=765915 RepID=A0A1Y2H8I5_9FUNG|nr:hypothetical protein BCR44DRAFT_1541131 [Catenaria anguillulae PL171]
MSTGTVPPADGGTANPPIPGNGAKNINNDGAPTGDPKTATGSQNDDNNNDGFTLVTKRGRTRIGCAALRTNGQGPRPNFGIDDSRLEEYSFSIPKGKRANINIEAAAAAALDFHQYVLKVVFSYAGEPLSTMSVQGIGEVQVTKHAWVNMDGMDGRIVGWAGPVSRAKWPQEIAKLLMDKWGVVSTNRAVDVLGSKFVQVSFRSVSDRDAAKVAAPLFFGNQYTSLYETLEDFKKNYKDTDVTRPGDCGG